MDEKTTGEGAGGEAEAEEQLLVWLTSIAGFQEKQVCQSSI